MNVEVIALNDKNKLSFAHRVDTTVENHYRGWNIPGVEYWMPFNNPLKDYDKRRIDKRTTDNSRKSWCASCLYRRSNTQRL